jgi:antitoxin PrlF
MESIRSRVTAQGQVSVPAEIRRHLGVAAGSLLEWEEQGDVVVVRRASAHSSEDLHAALFDEAKPKRKRLAEYDVGIESDMKSRYARR